MLKKVIADLISKKYKSKIMRYLYWNIRAKDVDLKWGSGTQDYEVITSIINKIKPAKILDIGCGSGRLFDLYEELEIKEIVAQDISNNAIKIAKEKHYNSNITYFCGDIESLRYNENYFDLVISNRVLSAIIPEDIYKVVEHLAEISQNVYINEMASSDFCGESNYWFKHDYDSIFRKYNLEVIYKGNLGKQTYKLYGKRKI